MDRVKKIKILYIVSTLKRSGPINILYGIIKDLDKNLFEVNIITLSPEGNESRENDFLELGAIITKINKSRIGMIFSGKKHLFKYIDKINPDIIHSHGFRADYYNTQYKKSISFTTIHNYPHKDYIMEYGRFIGRIMYRKQIKYIKQIKYSVVCSKSISQELYDIFGIKTLCVQNGIDIRKYKNELKEYEIVNTKRKLKLPEDKKIIISVGKLNYRKNPIYLIESFLKSDIGNDYYLILLGDGPLEVECKKKFGNKVIILGNVDNVEEYLKISDIFVSASIAEGLPNAVLEAMANAIPVVISNIPPHKEILETNLNSGLLFEFKDNDLINKFNSIKKYNLKKMGCESKKVVTEYFSSKRMSEKYAKLYINAVRK